MRTAILTIGFAIAAQMSLAGAMTDPVVVPAPEIMVETKAASSSISGQTFVILSALVVLGSAMGAK